MSLDTVLKIGKALRQADNSLKYFKYIEPCPVKKDKEGNKIYPICITIPVKNDFKFDWNNVKITPENERDDLYYLKFKTSNSDGLVKYLFGDIYYAKKSKINKNGTIETKEAGYYRLENPSHSNAAYRLSSFNRGFNDYNALAKGKLDDSIIIKFHETIKKELKNIETLLSHIPAIEKYFHDNYSLSLTKFIMNKELIIEYERKQIFASISNVNLKKIGIECEYEELNAQQKQKLSDYVNAEIFIHFEFPEEKHWYQFNKELKSVNEKILSDFVDVTENGLVLKKTLYKTLCSGDKKNDTQFPFFKLENKHKSKAFSSDELQDLFYAIDYSSKGQLVYGTDIKRIVLPLGANLNSKDYCNFIEKRDEAKILYQNKKHVKETQPLFDFVIIADDNITAFDLIFCKKGSLTSPDTDLIEISGIEKSKLRQTMERIENIKNDVKQKRQMYFRTQKELSNFKIEYSFQNILGSYQNDEKKKRVSVKSNTKYQSHLLKVLPLIYTDNYYQDKILLPAFIQNVEFTIRVGYEKFSFLKFDLMFLYKIQNSKNDKYMEITNSESYKLGLLLGSLAKNLALEINSFEKNYVGNLSRRLSTLPDFIKLKNEIEQKLIMHDKSKYTFQTSYDLAQKVKDFASRYDKEECAFGFLESYFKPLPKKQNIVEN